MDNTLLSLIILLPLLGATVIGLLGFLSHGFRHQEKLIGGIGTLMVAIPFLIIVNAFVHFTGGGHGEHGHQSINFSILPWMEAGNIKLNFSYHLDQLSLLMGMIVTGIGSLIHIYSIGYMHHDKGYYKFFMYLNLFIFAMLNLILGDNMVVLFLGWEGVGLCSYLLIGFWYEDMEKAKAAQKAFVANRIGDFAMICAMFLIYSQSHSFYFSDILATSYGDSAFWITLLLFIAATGKSAQIPLYVWLPDAMAGPTPVSALIHAATMVTSGIYLITRLHPIFNVPAAEPVLMVIAVVAAMTAIVAALIAVAQNDIKKVLAYSTVSQLGFMFMALGAGAYTTAIFHVMTHAFFKACLFLGSGSVIHAMDHMHTVKDPQDIRTMGGLGKYMPSTSKTFWISTLAIAGIFPLSGFFSKDEILANVFFSGFDHGYVYFFVWGVGTITACLTAFYMTRVTYLTFNGKERFPHSAHPHESSPLMTIPLWILAVLAAVGGGLGLNAAMFGHDNHILNHTWFHGLVNNRDLTHVMHENISLEWALIILAFVISFGMVFYTYNFYKKYDVEGEAKVQKLFGGMYKAMENKFYVDEFYERTILKPFVWAGDNIVMWFDKNVIDKLVDGTGALTTGVGEQFRKMQTGFVTHYAFVIVMGVIALLGYLLLA